MWQPAFAHNSGNTSHRAVKTLHPVTTDYSIFPLTGTESAVATSIRKHFEETIMHNLVCYRKINSCSCSQICQHTCHKGSCFTENTRKFFLPGHNSSIQAPVEVHPAPIPAASKGFHLDMQFTTT